MGQCGILENMDGSLNFCYAYDKKYWGKGYATEAGKAILNYLFNNFNTIKDKENNENHSSVENW